MKAFYLLSIISIGLGTSYAQKPAYLVKNLAPANTVSPSNSVWASIPCVSGNHIFYASNSGNQNGFELWKTDGSLAGTKMLKDLEPYGNPSEENRPQGMTDVNGTVYFYKIVSHTLYKTDGTAARTVVVKEDLNIGPSSYSAFYQQNQYFTGYNNQVFFINNDAATGVELWKSDGTAAGTTLVKDVNPGSGSSTPTNFTVSNGFLYFTVNISGNYQLWKTNGTTAGTEIIANFHTDYLTDVNGTLYFLGSDGSNNGLWKSDGTVAGTVFVHPVSPKNLTNVNGTLFFQGYTINEGVELWKSDGTLAGTVIVKDIIAGSGHSLPTQLTNVNGTLFFVAADPTNGYELWKSDGTEAGTVLVKDIYPGGPPSSINYMTNVNGILFFTAENGISGNELWRSDGTAAGTLQIADLYPGSSGSTPITPIAMNGVLYFNAISPITNSLALWRSDGTAAGTFVLDDRRQILNNFTNLGLIAKGDEVFFNNYVPGSTGFWKSDGTAAGTGLVVDKPFYEIININNTLYLYAEDAANGIELWKSDGTPAGTALVKDINPGSGSSFESETFFRNVNGTLFFLAYHPSSGRELWKSDGTTAGTVLVKDIVTGTAWTDIREMTVMGNVLYFTAVTVANGRELWRSDGTAAGTYMVKDIVTGSGSSNPGGLYTVNNQLYFTANFYELWKSDGTAAGTTLVYTFSASTPKIIGGTTNHLFISRESELWRSDGTNAGTFMIKSFTVVEGIRDYNASYGYPYSASINNIFYFRTGNSSNVAEEKLWKSDGTAAGTVFIKAFTLTNEPLKPIGNELYFCGNIEDSGLEVLKTDGTTAGTVVVANIDGGVMNSYPTQMTPAGDKLFFLADYYLISGKELYKIDISCTSPPVSPTASGVTIPTNTRTTLSATCPAGETQWYTQSSGGEGLFSGGSLTTPFLTANKTYYVACEKNLQCQSARTSVLVTVTNPCPSSLPISSPNYTTGDDLIRQANAVNGVITATNQITNTAKITYQSKAILLDAGFKAQLTAGGYFKAEIGGCN